MNSQMTNQDINRQKKVHENQVRKYSFGQKQATLYCITALMFITVRAFSVAGPAAWNCPSDELHDPLLTANSFRQLLKTLLQSTSAYSVLEVLHIMRYINLLTYLL